MKHKLLIASFILLSVVALLYCRRILPEINAPVIEQQNQKVVFNPEKEGDFEEGVLLVEFKNNATQKAVPQAKLDKYIHTKAMQRYGKNGFYKIKADNLDAELDALTKSPDVRWASKNFKVSTIQTYPNDPYYTNNSLWGMNNIHASTAWQYNKGDQNVFVGLIDEGIMYWHQDLCGQIWDNPFDTLDGVDNDGNGYIDDIHGWDFYHNDKTIFDFKDQHGTHTAGTIGANGNNGVGVIGVSPNVTIISAKFLEGTGWIDAAILATDYLTDLKVRHNLNLVGSSNSWGGSGYVQGMKDAIDRAALANMLFFAAAGNNNSNNDGGNPFYPASYTSDNVISVAATTPTDGLAGFSNYGLTSVDLGGPGQGVYSTTYGTNFASTYSSFSGTSMATPHVAGAAALWKAAHPGATYQQVKTAILESVRLIPALAGKCATGGTLDMASFTTPVTVTPIERGCIVPFIDTTPPTAPTNVHAIDSTNSTIKITWNPSSDPESGIYFYGVLISGPLGNFQVSTFNTTVNIGGLAQGTAYTFTVYAINNVNQQSGPSIPYVGHTTGVPDIEAPTVPGNWRITGTTTTSISMAWNASTDNVGVYVYNIYMKGHPTEWSVNAILYPAQGLAWTANDLPPNTTFGCIIRAGDLSGNWSAWTDSIYATTGEPPPPPPPTCGTVAGLSSSAITSTTATVSWSALSGANSYDVDYKLASSATWINAATATSSLFVNLTGLTASSLYDWRVRGNCTSATGAYAQAQFTTSTPPPPPPPNYTLISTIDGSANGLVITVNWNITTNGTISNVQLQERKGGSVWQTIYAAPNTATGTHTHTVNSPGQYFYRIFAAISQGVSGYSNEKQIHAKKK